MNHTIRRFAGSALLLTAIPTIATLLLATGRATAQAVRFAQFDIEQCAALDCNCPGCLAYVEACGQGRYANPNCQDPCWSGQGVPGATPTPMQAPPTGTSPQYSPSPSTGAPTDPGATAPIGPTPGAAGPVPSMTAGGATAVALAATPNQIGDLFGVSSGSTVLMLDRLFVIAQDLDAQIPGSPGAPFTVSESPSSVAIAEGFSIPGAVVVPNNIVATPAADAEFTTAVTTSEMETTLLANPDARIPIVNNGTYQSLAEAELISRNGNGHGATTFFNSGDSFAHLQDAALPGSGPGNGEDYDAAYAYEYVVELPIDAIGGAPGAAVGRQKMSENGNPIPRDRLIDSFSFFDNTPLIAGGKNVTRNVIGIEKTFFDGLTSLEFRLPFAATLDNNLTLSSAGVTGSHADEFGNMVLYLKTLMWQDDMFAVGAGLGVTMPTAADVIIRDTAGTDVVRVGNESPHLMPYLGVVCAPNRQLFWQAMLQLDIDMQGNPVYLSPFQNGAYTGNLAFADRLRDKDLLYADFSIGYWCYQRRRPTTCISGFAPIFELHYNGGIDRGDPLIADGFRSGAGSSFDLLNGVFGSVIQFGGNTNLSLAYVTPIAGDEQFDGEFRMSLNWYFGPFSSRNAQSPF